MRGNPYFKWVDRWLGIPLVLILGIWRRLKPGGHLRELKSGDRVLVIKFSAMGDTLLLLPILKAFKERVGKQGRVEVLATRINQDAFKMSPFVDALHYRLTAEP